MPCDWNAFCEKGEHSIKEFVLFVIYGNIIEWDFRDEYLTEYYIDKNCTKETILQELHLLLIIYKDTNLTFSSIMSQLHMLAISLDGKLTIIDRINRLINDFSEPNFPLFPHARRVLDPLYDEKKSSFSTHDFLKALARYHVEGLFTAPQSFVDWWVKLQGLQQIQDSSISSMAIEEGETVLEVKQQDSTEKEKYNAIALVEHELRQERINADHEIVLRVGLLSLQGNGLLKVATTLNGGESTAKWTTPRRERFIAHMLERHGIDVSMLMPQRKDKK